MRAKSARTEKGIQEANGHYNLPGETNSRAWQTAHTCNPNTQQVESRGLGVQGHMKPGLREALSQTKQKVKQTEEEEEKEKRRCPGTAADARAYQGGSQLKFQQAEGRGKGMSSRKETELKPVPKTARSTRTINMGAAQLCTLQGSHITVEGISVRVCEGSQ